MTRRGRTRKQIAASKEQTVSDKLHREAKCRLCGHARAAHRDGCVGAHIRKGVPISAEPKCPCANWTPLRPKLIIVLPAEDAGTE